MSKVDWSLAPEGATHKETSCPNGFWYKFDFHNNQACFWIGKGWTNPISADAYNDGSMDTMELRPAKPWSGPEDGLPPVGSVCEQQTWVNRLWRKVEVVAHFNKFAVCAWEESPGDSQVELAPPYDLRLPTDEIDQRETAIRELMDIAQVDCRVTAARLVDAGFKREVV